MDVFFLSIRSFHAGQRSTRNLPAVSPTRPQEAQLCFKTSAFCSASPFACLFELSMALSFTFFFFGGGDFSCLFGMSRGLVVHLFFRGGQAQLAPSPAQVLQGLRVSTCSFALRVWTWTGLASSRHPTRAPLELGKSADNYVQTCALASN